MGHCQDVALAGTTNTMTCGRPYAALAMPQLKEAPLCSVPETARNFLAELTARALWGDYEKLSACYPLLPLSLAEFLDP